MSILTDQGRITAIEPIGARSAPNEVRIDISGKFVVPGYNDMHSHVLELKNPSGALALMLTDGITGFRQMSGSDQMLLERQQNLLPIGQAAPAPLQMPGDILTPFNATSPEAVAEEIYRQKAQGADFVKAGVMNAPVFVAALNAALEANIPLLGHLQDGVDAGEAAYTWFCQHRASGSWGNHLGLLLHRRGGTKPGLFVATQFQASTHQDPFHERAHHVALSDHSGESVRLCSPYLRGAHAARLRYVR